MEISKKVKLVLDETRMLVLGVQVLIGLQFRSVFQSVFENLPPLSRTLDGLALLLMVCALGLLILPGLFHRIVEEGRNSGRLHALICNVTLGACSICNQRWCRSGNRLRKNLGVCGGAWPPAAVHA